MTSVRTYQRPSSLEEAWSLLNENGKSAKLVGGGIDVALHTPTEVTTLIDVSQLGSRSIELRDGALILGASATLTELLESSAVADYLDGVIATMLQQVASPLLRNVATLAGTLASTHPWSDVITLFLALDARVTQFAGEVKTKALGDLLENRGTMDRAIITEVALPAFPQGTVASFESFVRSRIDVAMLNCACRLTWDGNCRDVRVVFGGTPSIGHRLISVEDALTGKALTSETIESAVALASESIDARDDLRASADYRRILAGNGLRVCCQRMAQKVGE